MISVISDDWMIYNNKSIISTPRAAKNITLNSKTF